MKDTTKARGRGYKKSVKDQPEKPTTLPIQPEQIPTGLKAARVWVCWRWDRNGERGWTKPPYDAATMKKADVTKSEVLASFEDALARVASGQADGIGVVLSAAGLLGIDLDDCRHPETGELEPWAVETLRALDTYCEVSPSGTGVKALVVASKPGTRCRAGDIELYDVGRYFTITGHTVPGFPGEAESRQPAVDALYAKLFPEPDRTAPPRREASPPPPPDADDEQLLEVAFRAKNGVRLRRLFEGDTSGYPSASEADLALCSLLAFYFRTTERTDRIFRRSALCRKKWLERDDYRERTLVKAIAGRANFYDPQYRSRSTAPDGGSEPTGTAASVPEIVVGPDEGRVNDAAARALAGAVGVYQRGGLLVHILDQEEDSDPTASVRRAAGSVVVRDLSPPLLRDQLTRCARFFRLVKRKEGDELVPVSPPASCVQAVHARGMWPRLSNLNAVVTHPVFLPNGTLLATNGYDRASGIYLRMPKGLSVTVPDCPTRRDVLAARDLLLDVVSDFPFAHPHHRSAWLAALLTPLVWFAFEDGAPMFLVDANVRGVGKGLLLDVIALTVLGHRFAVMTYTPDRDELRKQITTLALEGERLVLFDNLEGRIGNGVLDAALTADWWKGRVLGVNRNYEGPLSIVWYGNANNAQLGADTARRTNPIRLESALERPEERTDIRRPNLRRYIREQRGPLLSAALTILKGWYAAGRPRSGVTPWGSYDGWTDLVRECVVWLELPDPGDARTALRVTADCGAIAMGILLQRILAADPHRRGLTAGEMIDRAKVDPDLRSAIDELARKPDTTSLGYALRSYARRVFEGYFLDRAGSTSGAVRWAVFTEGEFHQRRE